MKLSNSHKEIISLIETGEGLQLDFKHEIDDSKKIARSLSAFANTHGGRLFIGVKDNGRIAGIRTEEEIHMLQAASEMYSSPEISFETKLWNFEGKSVIEAVIPFSAERPHLAPDHNGNMRAYIRKHDQNFVAHIVQLEVWKKNSNKSDAATYSSSEKLILDYLLKNQTMTLKNFMKITGKDYNLSKIMLADMIILDVLELHYELNKTVFRIKS